MAEHITYRRRLLEHLLVAALHAAVALEQVHGVAVCVGEHLQLDVAGLLQVPLDEDAVVAEACDGFALAGVHAVAEAVGGSDDAHALAAAAQHCLDHHRVPGGGRAWGTRVSAIHTPPPPPPQRGAALGWQPTLYAPHVVCLTLQRLHALVVAVVARRYWHTSRNHDVLGRTVVVKVLSSCVRPHRHTTAHTSWIPCRESQRRAGR